MRTRIGTALLVPLVVALPLGRFAAASAAEPSAASHDVVARLAAATGGTVTIAKNARSGRVALVGATPDHPFPRAAGLAKNASAEESARGFLRDFGSVLGVADESKQLRALPHRPGSRAVRFQQLVNGVPVIAGELTVDVLPDGSVVSADGETSSATAPSTTPTVASAEAASTAIAAAAKAHHARSASLRAVKPVLSIYDRRLLGAPGPDGASLVWRTAVTSGGASTINEYVLVDALTGKIALQFGQVEPAKVRRVCNRNNVVNDAPCASPYTRSEGQGPTGIADVDKAYDFAGNTYDFYFSKFGRDSLNGSGLPLLNTVKFCGTNTSCPWQNAAWNGSQMLYGDGFASADDVVGHELTHGVTQFESNLLYYYQSGAINESLSDVFGEFVDLTNGAGNDTAGVRWLLGEDLTGVGAIRNMANPPAFSDPDRITSSLYTGTTGDNGGVHTNSGVNNKAASLMVDGGTFNGRTVTALGIDKVARFYYKAQVDLLTSGSDYSDLGNALAQACTSLVGTASITSANCTEVRDAVLATEMATDPPNAPAPEAPLCASGEVPTNLFFDNLENSASGNWALNPASGTSRFFYPDHQYATSGTTDIFGADPATTSDSTIARTANVVPPPGSTTYLHFKHGYDLESGFDGGRVEYSTNNGSTWTDAAPLFTHNGYTASSSAWGGLSFTGVSNGYRSSRINLTSLAGQNVRFRFHVKSDSSIGHIGWFIDDVRVYTCAVPAPAVAAAKLVSSDAKNPSVAFNGTNYLVAWESPHSGTGDPDIRAARVSPTGTVLDTSGIPVSTAAVNEQHPTVVSDGSNFLVVWEDARNGVLDLYGSRINASGSVLNPTGIAISTATGIQRNPDVAYNGTNYLVAWEDLRTGGANIDAARVSTTGTVLDATGIGVSTLSSAEQEPSVASDGAGFLVGWTDLRAGPLVPRIEAARLNGAGAVLDASGIAVSGTNNGTQPTLTFNGTNYFAAWRGGSGIVGARVTPAGSVLDATLIPISTAPDDQNSPSAARLGTDVVVVWRDRRFGTNYDLYAARVTASGTVRDTSGFSVSAGGTDEGAPDLVSRGGNPAVNGVVYDVLSPAPAKSFLRTITAPK